jgi:membrane fusion protein (multidrug efflux system)
MVRALLVFAALGLIWAAYWFFCLRPVESTDDAYVAGNQVRIAPKTSGTVMEILTDNTETVAAGQVVARLDPADALLALNKAESELGLAVRRIFSQKAQLSRLEAVIEARERELALVRNEYRRRLNLEAGASVTVEEVERYSNQTAVAEANLKAARLELEAAARELGAGETAEHPQVALAAARLREAWLALQRCEIQSPAAGRTARRTVQVGAQVTPATPLLAVVPLDEIWVEANFKESQLGRIKPGHRALVRADMYGRAVEYHGLVAGLSAGTGSVFALLPAENATGNWIKVVQRAPVKIILDRREVEANPLLLGLSLRVEVQALEAPGPVPAAAPAYRAFPADEDLEGANRLIDDIIRRNLEPGPGPEGAAEKGQGS